ncbi:hypothetical protein CL615_02560 [archaeon]|jgi:hypothetical protein|nr:hypothetical protein [archaeon]MDP6547758.1 hypothetical protein [Candidatus Woesearchaeota archaeon]|tara:strand:+ start:52865 stop:53539 length:675 start_codon:yes stop_codon:yes gene_type:complete
MYSDFLFQDINFLGSFGYTHTKSGLEKAVEDKRLFDTLTENLNEKVKISPNLYFYIIVNKYMKEIDIEDKDIIFYVGDILTKFVDNEILRTIPKQNEKIEHVLDAINFGHKSIDKRNKYAAFDSYKHAGELALFISGIFYEYILKKENRRVLMPEHYVPLGSSSFTRAINLNKYFELGMPIPSGMMALSNPDNFKDSKLVLHKLSDYHLNFDDKITILWKRLMS